MEQKTWGNYAVHNDGISQFFLCQTCTPRGPRWVQKYFQCDPKKNNTRAGYGIICPSELSTSNNLGDKTLNIAQLFFQITQKEKQQKIRCP